MARGPKKHLKRLAAPKHWMLDKLGGEWAPRPSTGPHKLRECLPLCLILRNRLKYALTGREVMMIVMRRLVEIDHKIRTDVNYPAGFMDVITIAKSNEKFRLLYDVKGRFVLQKINTAESKFKLLKVVKKFKSKKASIGRNPFQTGQAGTIPVIVTHDGRTIRYPDPKVKIHDTVKFDLKENKITDIIKFEIGNICMVTKGANTGRVGVLVRKEAHPGSFGILHLKDKKGNEFATREANVFAIGNGEEAMVKLPRSQGVKNTIMEDREQLMTKNS
eukprot:CAMPEP_0185260952 /NCGR_PEP_ID=MMETSP1359-20130426/9458_1 /TAXON_ID=552665 /ORGANISM="Bigelowiella longifila, Strain CCMP242" /LENGTH=274 /DNA_ID=CAMNT_0027847411 /DNA_START=27 /DNA_END=851 /DNA_ORIENTATION=-